MTLRLNGSTSGYVEIDAPAVAGTSALTLPTGTGTLATQAYANSAASSASGLVLISTQTFNPSLSELTFNSVFNSTYRNYKIIISITDTNAFSGTQLSFRLRSASGDETGSVYRQSINGTASATTGTTGWADVAGYSTSYQVGVHSSFDLLDPNIAGNTVALGLSTNISGSPSSPAVQVRSFAGHVLSNTQYIGFKIISSNASAPNGSVSVYGYR